ncbi:MAG: hypothetical protein Q8P81_01555, partial [Nanoarchaeota archaeon]|nr:hypothetical protein [Nanoarchaeota archaeon]
VALTSEQKIKMTFEACKSDQDCREFGAVCSLGFCSPREFEGLSCKLSSGRGATVFYEGKNVNNPFYMKPKFKQKGSASPVQESSCVSGDSSKIRVPICSESGVSFEVRDCEEGMGCVDGECSSLSFNFNLINEEIFEIRDIMATKNRVQRSSSGNVIYEYFIAHGGSFSIEKGQDYTAIFFEGTLLSGQAPIQYRFESSGEHTHIYRSVILQEQSDSEEHYIFSIDERISSTSRVDSSDLIHFSKRGSEEEKALENFISQLEDIKKNVLDYAVTGEEDYLFTASSNCVVDLNLVFDGATSYQVAGNDLIVELDGNLLSFYGDFDDEIAVFGCDDEGCSGGKAFITSDSGGITGNVVRANQDSNAVVKCTQSQRDLYLELANAENPFVEFRSLTFSGRGQIVDGKVGSDLMRLTNKGDIVRSVDLYIPAGLDTKNSYATSTGDRIESITISSSKTSNILGKSGEEAEYIVLKTVEDYYVDTAKGVSEIKKGIYLVPLDYKDIVSKAGLEKSRSLKELLERYDSNSGTRNGIIFLNSEDGSKFEIPSERGITFSNNGLNYAFVSLASNPEFEAGDYAVPVKRKESLGGSSRGPWSYDFGRMRDIQEAFRPGFIEEWYNAGKNFLTNDLFGVLDRSR